MGRYFSDKVEEGIRLVWMQYDREEMARGVELLAEAADEGDADAIAFLARTYMGSNYVWEGGNFPEDDDKASRYIKDSVMKGSAVGVLCAMRCGEFTPALCKNMPFASLKEAFDIVLQKAEAGHPFCQYMVGNAYCWGDMIVIEDLKIGTDYPTEASYNAYAHPKAADWYEKAVRGGYYGASLNLNHVCSGEEKGFPADKERALKWILYSARHGFPPAMHDYACELDDAGNEAEAFEWFKKAADAGNFTSCYRVGWCLEYGRGISKNEKEALKYYRCGAEHGNSDCQFKVGNFYYRGITVDIDYGKAVFWLEKAAEQQNIWAYAPLGDCYLRGRGVQRDYKTARYWLEQANERSEDLNNFMRGIALNALGVITVDGLGVEPDMKRGIALLKSAIKCDNNDAKINLARFKKTFWGKWVRR